MPDSIAKRCAILLLAATGSLLAIQVPAKSPPNVAGPLTVHVRNDSMTLRVAKAPQAYLAGTIDDAAVAQVRQLLEAGKLVPGSDVYLDSSAGDIVAGMELGRLFRASRFNTHLGTWHTGNSPALPATCLDACAYAYLGGVYRWSPSGSDRIGLHDNLQPARAASSAAQTPDANQYVEAMGVRPAEFAQVAGLVVNGVAWWSTEKLASTQVANNGRLPLEAAYQKAPGTPSTLLLSQMVHGKQDQVTLQCAPGQITLAARYVVGAERTGLLAARAMYAYFQVGGQPWQMHQGERPHADGDALVFSRTMPFAQLTPVLQSMSLGVWFEITGSPVRVGFWVAPLQVEKLTQPFLADCQAMQPGYVPPKPADSQQPQARPSFWKKLVGKLRN
ncbi:hypothetical protein [Rhodanobacter sp. DHB23]|uniref:hypothetical protein n=1 Tax=Rhodanobacter sp. DHB23 TaxID=2775923 RepID=UPI00177F0502|nr:hypothetical protein [Rhodanobacter sp. DHB23]MBD8873747.1 hypothetical protein [Rhodanobacter sp. DHB23]